MTAVSGTNLRAGEAYWELSGPKALNLPTATCRSCKKMIMRGMSVFVRDGRKLRFFYHAECFSGDEDPRTQFGSSYQENAVYHKKLAPKVSSLEGPRACHDADGRVLGRAVFKNSAPSVLGTGKWSVSSRGFKPKYTNVDTIVQSKSQPTTSSMASPEKK